MTRAAVIQGFPMNSTFPPGPTEVRLIREGRLPMGLYGLSLPLVVVQDDIREEWAQKMEVLTP